MITTGNKIRPITEEQWASIRLAVAKDNGFNSWAEYIQDVFKDLIAKDENDLDK